MSTHPNLADPDFEPTDEQLSELMKRAFANVAKENEAAMQRLREEIKERTKRARERFNRKHESSALSLLEPNRPKTGHDE